jgi:hypothetical protein
MTPYRIKTGGQAYAAIRRSATTVVNTSLPPAPSLCPNERGDDGPDNGDDTSTDVGE